MDTPDSPTLFHHDETMPPIEPGTFGFGSATISNNVALTLTVQ